MKKVVGLGDLLCSLSAPGYKRFFETDTFNVFYTGAVANVLASLSYMGVETEFVTRLPGNDIARAAEANLNKYGISTRHIATGGDRLGVIFVETGASQRSSKVIYDRKFTGAATMRPEHFDWDAIFDRAGTFVIAGILPALSGSAAETTLYAVKEAKKRGIYVSCDINYRRTLWSYEQASAFFEKILPDVDMLIANQEHADLILGVRAPQREMDGDRLSQKGCELVAKGLSEKYGASLVGLTLRYGRSASDTTWGAMMYENGKAYYSKLYDIHVVGRIGGGDAFVAGLIYGNIFGFDSQKKIDFATACGVLKHSIGSDFNAVSAEEALALIDSDGCGRVQR